MVDPEPCAISYISVAELERVWWPRWAVWGNAGRYALANGCVYVGEYADGKRDGKGTFTWASGMVDVCRYKGGDAVGEAEAHKGHAETLLRENHDLKDDLAEAEAAK